MKKIVSKIFIFTLLFFWITSFAQAATPVLNFSDIVSGPDTGLGDGLGSGAIVTIWGNNFGSTQGASKIYFADSGNTKREAAHIYYWKNADGLAPGGPANLYESHKMQEIAFSIPSSIDGIGQITVEVNGTESNGLPFTVRSGNIYYVSSSGSDSNDGSWASPWRYFGYHAATPDGASTKMVAGDIAYGLDVTEDNIGLRVNDGTTSAHDAIISYPGHRCTAGSVGVWNIADKAEYWDISKLAVIETDASIEPTRGGRIVGNEVYDGSSVGNTPHTDCAEGGSGAISSAGNQEGSLIIGNYIHDYGCYATSNQHHTMYFSVRSKGRNIEPVEIAYNHLYHNWARGGIHFYDEHACWGYSGENKIHHNFVNWQVGAGFDLGANICDNGYTLSGNFAVYNNIFKNNGQLGANNDGIEAVHLFGEDATGQVKFYNNSIVGYGYASATSETTSGAVVVKSSSWSSNWPFGGSYEFKNNIIVDDNDLPFSANATYQKTPTSSWGNLWYNGGDIIPSTAPAWDTSPLSTDPQFVSITDFHLQSTSPAINTGLAIPIVLTDFEGISRPQGVTYDIGAYEYQSSGSVEIRADVDQNSNINSTDAMLTLRNSLTLDMSSTDWQASATTGDVNCDDTTNSTDAMLILRQSLGLSMAGTGWCVS